MNENTHNVSENSVTFDVRQQIRAQIKILGDCLETAESGDIERRSKALAVLFKFTQTIDEQDIQEQKMRALDNEKAHTPYDQIPPPNDEEMRIIQDRLNRLYNHLRAAGDPKLILAGDEEQ